MTNMTKEMASNTRSMIVASKGARFPRLSFHKVTNSTEWFFFIIMARKKGAMQSIMTNAANSEPQMPGSQLRHNGTNNLKATATIATLTIE